jgi:tetratricopeptide (TPR) repeat protein
MPRKSLFRSVHRLPRVGVLAAAALALSASLAAIDVAAQVQPAIQQRLDTVREQLFSGTGRPDRSIQELKAILAIDPGSAEGHLLLGIAYRTAGSSDLMGEAVAELRQALALNDKYVPARFYLAHLYLDLGRPERAREELQAALAQSPQNPQFMALLGETERQLRNPARAVELTRDALKVDPASDESRYYLGLALFDLGRRDEAIAELERVVQAQPRLVDPYLSLGTAYLEAERFDDALRVLRIGAQVDPANPEVRIQLARAYRSKGALDSAEAQLKLAVPNANGALAASQFQHQKVEFDLDFERAMITFRRGRLELAGAAFRKVLETDSNHGPAHRYLAEVYLQQGRFARAEEHAARAEQLGAPLPAVKRKLIQQKLGKQEPGARQ